MKQSSNRTLVILLFLGLIVRLFFIPNPGFEADVAYWKSWSLAAADHGPFWTIKNTNYNYPPAFIYLLWVLGKVYELVGNPHDYNTYWQNNNLAYLFISKLIPILSDLVIAVLLYFLGKKILAQKARGTRDTLDTPALPARFACLAESRRAARRAGRLGFLDTLDTLNTLPLLMAALYLFNPAVIIDGALWGQVDSLGVAIFLASLTLLFLKKPLWASAVFTLSFLLKLQGIIYIPIFFLFVLLRFGSKTFFKSVAAATATFLLLCSEYILRKDSGSIFRLMFQNADWFPYLSLNAYNPWWLVSGANGMGVSDKILVLGIINAKTLGLILFSGAYLLCLGLIAGKKPLKRLFSIIGHLPDKKQKFFVSISFENLFLACLLAVFSFFLLLTQSHDRYIFPSLVFIILLLPYWIQRYQKVALWKILFVGLSVTAFYNLHNALVHFYPKNGLPIISSLNTKPITKAVSIANMALFGTLVWWVLKKVSSLFWLATSAFIVFAIIFLDLSFWSKKPVSLTKLKPISQRSDYSPCVKNMAVNSNFGWKNWNRLSVNYFFYKKGFGCHANSELGFDLDQKFKRLTTDIGVDTEANVNSSVIFKILGDGQLLFESQKMGRFDLPQHVELDLNGTKTLILKIEDAGDGKVDDHADWLNPVLYR